jgi:tetratricopeptide (TPR) repeat protein
MNKNIILISIITLFSFKGICQSFPIKAANKLYASKLYFQAIPKYEKILMKDDANQDVLSNLSECYRLTNNFQGQISCYEKLVSAGKIQDLQKLYYGQALMQAGKYEEAKVYLDEYKTDKRGEELSRILSRVDDLTKNQDAYEVGNVNFNSDDDDFSAFPFINNKIVFASTKSKNAWINRKHGWTGNNYCNMYITELV